MESIYRIIDSYPDEYNGIKKQAKKYIQNDSNIDDTGRVNILHRPWVARLNWGLMLYKGADKEWIDKIEKSRGRTIPGFYKDFLRNINGCFLYDISLCGLINSLTRSFLQCHSLETANNSWIAEYKVDQSFFHFGGGHYSYDENCGYFFDGTSIISILKNGRLLNEWNSFSEFLNDELVRAEQKMLLDTPKNIKLIISQ